jgi:DNA-binding NtrC family response regulator
MPERFHILVVDDEPNVLITYRLILEQQGYRVSAAISSADARNILSADSVDLLLCDLSLEGQESGFDVIEYAKRLTPEIATVLLTGYATPEANERAESSGIPVLFKPIDIQQLLETISRLLRNDHELRQASGE